MATEVVQTPLRRRAELVERIRYLSQRVEPRPEVLERIAELDAEIAEPDRVLNFTTQRLSRRSKLLITGDLS